jgi:pimeloyl-ACP methyl ester carboxylesterase
MESYEGIFDSPSSFLPVASRTGRFQLVLPAARRQAPVLVALASSGDEGYGLRRRLFLPLIAQGIGVLLLENPFYGARRPPGQRGSNLRTVSDFFAMCGAAMREAVGLMEWLRERGHPVGVGGYSMGGSVAALAASLAPFPVAAMLCATGVNGASVLTRDLLSRQVHWHRLGDPEASRARFGAQCERISLARLRPPSDPASAVLLGCTRDGYVDKAGVTSLHDHWSGSTLRWMDAGHISAVAFRASALREATIEAFARRRSLPAAS